MQWNGESVKHPGYFWLAYHWLNLIPCCGPCNSGQGKKNQFPLTDPVGRPHLLHKKLTQAERDACKSAPLPSRQPDYYYLQPTDLDDRELPLLLHPYLHEPSEHLKFGKNGIEAARELPDGTVSAFGTNSIAVYDLWSDDLRGLRHDSQYTASLQLMSCILAERQLAGPAGDRLECRRRVLASMRQSVLERNPPFRAAVLDFLDHLEQNPEELV